MKAGRQKGFRGSPEGVRSDGHVNVGFIQAALAQPDILQFTRGIDLGTVSIDGDLGKIVAGDIFATPAIRSLQVRSLGALGTTTQGAGQGFNTTSLVLGPVNDLHVCARSHRHALKWSVRSMDGSITCLSAAPCAATQRRDRGRSFSRAN